MPVYSGHLVLAVGPSGAGKDSILRECALQLSNCSRYVFPRRIVTRPASLTTEDHVSMNEAEFAAAIAAGNMALHWRAHGNSYGLPVTMLADLAQGRTVVVNCSRAVIAEAVDRFPHVVIVEITAPVELLVARIVARGRETAAEATARVAREVPTFPSGVPVVRIVNDGPLARAVATFHDTLAGLEDAAPDPRRSSLDNKHQQEDGDNDGRRLVVVE